MKDTNLAVTRGAIAGFLAAAAVALWFLLVDFIQGQPFHTPAFLASTLAGMDRVTFGVGLLGMYTALHFASFILIGVVVAWLLERTHTASFLLFGCVLGFLLFDLLFYGGIVIGGVNVIRALGWPQALVGSLIGGITMMGYLRATGMHDVIGWSDLLSVNQTAREGMATGGIGALAVALWFLLVDLLRGQLLFTPGALGSALFFGAHAPSEVEITAATVIGYTVVHLVVFALFGYVAALLVRAAEAEAPFILGLVLLFAAAETLFIGLLAIVATWLLDTLSWWTVAVANLIAAAAMLGYLWSRHPQLRERLEANLEEELSGATHSGA